MDGEAEYEYTLTHHTAIGPTNAMNALVVTWECVCDIGILIGYTWGATHDQGVIDACTHA